MAIPNEPLSRLEQYLNRIATENGTIPEAPLTRLEMYLNRIATGSGNVPETPHTRIEMYLNKIATGSGNVPEAPYTRAEMYLNKIATGNGNTPEEALTRIEMYLAEIAQGGGGELVENFTRVGDPLIEDGILTSSSGGWIATPTALNGSNPWMLTVKVLRPSYPGAYEKLLLTDGNGVVVDTSWQSATTKLVLTATDGSEISNGQYKRSLTSGSWFWLKIGWNGSRYDMGTSTDGTTYKWGSASNYDEPFTGYNPISSKSAIPVKSGILQLGSNNSIAQFDLNETKIEVNGEVWWTPYVRG